MPLGKLHRMLDMSSTINNRRVQGNTALAARYARRGVEVAALVMLRPCFPIHPLDGSRLGCSPYGICPRCFDGIARSLIEVRRVARGSNGLDRNKVAVNGAVQQVPIPM